MREYDELQETIHTKVLVFRSIENLINSEEFVLLFNNMSANDRALIKGWATSGNNLAIRSWIAGNRQRLLPVNDWTLEMLRSYASAKRIHAYASYNKGTLIKIVKAEMAKENQA